MPTKFVTNPRRPAAKKARAAKATRAPSVASLSAKVVRLAKKHGPAHPLTVEAREEFEMAARAREGKRQSRMPVEAQMWAGMLAKHNPRASSVTSLPWWKRAYDERATWESYQRAPWQLRAGPAENWPALLDAYTTGGRDALHSWFVDKYPKMQDFDIDKRVEAFMEGLPTLREYAQKGNRRNPHSALTASVEQDRLSGGWSVHIHDGRRYMDMTGDAFSTEAAAKREAKALLAQARAGVPLETLGSMFWEKHHKPFAGHELDNPRRKNPSDLKPGMRVGKYRVEEVRKHDVVVSSEGDKGDGKEFYRVEATTLADLKRALKAKDEAYAQHRQFLSALDNPRRSATVVPDNAVFYATTRGGKYEIIVTPAGEHKGEKFFDLDDRTSGESMGRGYNNLAGLRARIPDMLHYAKAWDGINYEVKVDTLGLAKKANPRRKNPPKGFRIAGPAVKTMVDGLRISRADAQKLKDMMDTGAPRILQTADKMMNGHGVERISGVGGGLMYVNMGDTYDATLIYDYKTNRFVVSSWGDIVERQPRRFAD